MTSLRSGLIAKRFGQVGSKVETLECLKSSEENSIRPQNESCVGPDICKLTCTQEPTLASSNRKEKKRELIKIVSAPKESRPVKDMTQSKPKQIRLCDCLFDPAETQHTQTVSMGRTRLKIQLLFNGEQRKLNTLKQTKGVSSPINKLKALM